LLKNPRLKSLKLVNLNLYDIDIQTLVHNSQSLAELKHLSFKRSTFMDKIKKLDLLLGPKAMPKLTELNLNMTNLLAQLHSCGDFNNAIERNDTIKVLQIAALSQDAEDAKKIRFLLNALKKNRRIKSLNISENYFTPACFHVLRDIFMKNDRIKTLKFYLASSDRLFNEMFLDLQRFYEELIRRGLQAAFNLRTLIVSKKNPMNFPVEVRMESTVLYIGDGR
jgi:hypothetical protein